MTNFAEQLASAAEEDADRPAIKLDDHGLTYVQLDQAASRVAGMLRAQGVEPGDRVAVQLPTVPYFPIVFYGALRLGAVVVPLNPLLKNREVSYHLSDSVARVIVAWHEVSEAARRGSEEAGVECLAVVPGEFERLLGEADPVPEIVPRADDDTAVIIYTSGTTGTPKGAMLTNTNLAATARTARDICDIGPGDVTLATLPLFHVFGMSSVMNAALVGRAMLTMVPRFEPGKVLEVMQRDRATLFGGVPTMFTALLHHPDRERFDISSLKVCVSGGASLPVEVLRGFDAAFGCHVLEGYGLSETTGMATFNTPDRERKPGSIGVPIGGTVIRVVDDDDRDVPRGDPGELAMRGPFVMKGYWNRDDATKQVMRDGWFHTGDIAQFDDDGYLFIVDRKKDLIIRGGYNVYPRELEEVMYEHPAVREAAVVGIPHQSLGEEVGAAVALKPGAEVTPGELRLFMKERVAAYKYPRVIWLVDELPKGPTGKILKREITVPEGVLSA
ncbi:MAG TPA: long-chain fatty acid--CoA ligase [Solirubrobacteraceae bacterium]|nr:long-chain fatty acid--CoA ligase [Solirubrobacteraceae bacterium]